MILWSNQKRLWPQFYDTEALLQGADLTDGSTFVVDVGGHHGVDLFRVLDRHPNIPAGSLVLEDLPEVIASVNITTDKIRTVPYNFFEEGRQPVEGEFLLEPTCDEQFATLLRHEQIYRQSSVLHACRSS